MKYIVPLLIKFLIISFVLGVVLWTVGAPLIYILWISIAITALSFIGDLLLLPKYGNVVLTIIDFGLVFSIVLVGSAFLLGGIQRIGIAAFTPAIIIALWEAFFHKFLRKRFFEEAFPSIDATYRHFDVETKFGPDELAHLRTEFSNEFDIGTPYGEVKKKEKKKGKRYVPHRPKKRNKKNPY